jgi:hypothetical protein
MADTDRPQATVYFGAEKILFACWITKERIRTHTVFNIYCCPRQQWLGELDSLLRLYLHCCCLTVTTAVIVVDYFWCISYISAEVSHTVYAAGIKSAGSNSVSVFSISAELKDLN